MIVITAKENLNYLGINEEYIDPLERTFETLFRGMKKRLEQCNHIPHSWMWLHYYRVLFSPELIYNLKSILSKFKSKIFKGIFFNLF